MIRKEDIRKSIKAQKELLTMKEIEEKSSIICTSLFQSEEYQKAHCIYIFVSFNEEVRTEKIIKSALKEGKRVAVPKIQEKEMLFYYINSYEELGKGYYGILEPKLSVQALEPSALMILPGLAFDRTGHRIGYGKGYYDSYLNTHPMENRTGISYDFQRFDSIPFEEKDVKVNRLITEAGIFDVV